MKKSRNTIILLITLIAVVFIILIFTNLRSNKKANIENAVVPWNSGSTVDLLARALLPDVDVENIYGANGANGINDVYARKHDGKTLAAIGASTLITAKYTGFTEEGHDVWEIWPVAYSPFLIVVSRNSAYGKLEELISVIHDRPEQMICANAGNGTFSFLAAQLFAEKGDVNVLHEAYSGMNPAANAVIGGEADFMIAHASDIIDKLQSEELRALAVFDETVLNLSGVPYEIPPASDIIPEISGIMPLGEYYLLITPKDTPKRVLKRIDALLLKQSQSEEFAVFARQKGMIVLNCNRSEAITQIDRLAEWIRDTFIKSGFVIAE